MKYTFLLRDLDESLNVKKYIEEKIKLEYDEKNPDIVIAIGGDGTILNAVHKYPNATVFGIHTGHLGFYANYDLDDVDLLIDDINLNRYKIELLDTLECNFYDKDGKKHTDFALNEVTIVSPLRTLRLDVSVDDEYIESFRGTGFCVSTPYGSTAYNKSLHGSVVDTTLKVMQLTEIASINSNAYRTLSSPIILSSERILKLKAKNETKVFITFDHLYYDLDNFNNIDIFYKKDRIKLAYNTQKSFLNRINRTFLISKD